mmetsp:Transcript_195/g.389  ORF Transcript_195/g.389 Transcript_195/m.389 type:complete len:207 (+) Transcript_195:799-1419(+)
MIFRNLEQTPRWVAMLARCDPRTHEHRRDCVWPWRFRPDHAEFIIGVISIKLHLDDVLILATDVLQIVRVPCAQIVVAHFVAWRHVPCNDDTFAGPSCLGELGSHPRQLAIWIRRPVLTGHHRFFVSGISVPRPTTCLTPWKRSVWTRVGCFVILWYMYNLHLGGGSPIQHLLTPGHSVQNQELQARYWRGHVEPSTTESLHLTAF